MDLLAVMAVVAIAAALLVAMGRRERQSAMQAGSLANLRTIGALTASYVNDNKDGFPNYTWPTGWQGSTFLDLRNPYSAVDGASFQTIDIIRRRGHDLMLPRITGSAPQIGFIHQILVDYAADHAVADWATSPADRYRLQWSRDIPGFRAQKYAPYQPAFESGPNSTAIRWSYSSSYQIVPAFWQSDDDRDLELPSLVLQGSTHRTFIVINANRFKIRRASEVVFPSSKTMAHEACQWQFGGTDRYWTLPEARIGHLMADGAAIVRTTADANRGSIPTSPSSAQFTTISYQPSATELWEPQLYNPDGTRKASYISPGYFRWGRAGIKGRDFGGPEALVP